MMKSRVFKNTDIAINPIKPSRQINQSIYDMWEHEIEWGRYVNKMIKSYLLKDKFSDLNVKDRYTTHLQANGAIVCDNM